MKLLLKLLLLPLSLLLSNVALAQDQSATAEGTLSTSAKAPQYVFSYGFYRYDLQGKNTANTKIYEFDASSVDVHLMTATWLYSPKWTLIAFAPYIKNMVETVYFPSLCTGPCGKYRDFTEGMGDIRLMATTAFFVENSHLAMYDLSITLPTGSIDQYFTTAPTQRAAYNMQLGSGTPDFIAGASYTNTQVNWTHTARGQATIRGGRNANGWALGNEFLANLGSRYTINKFLNAGIAGTYKARGKVEGRDDKYELFNNVNIDSNVKGDGHQYYHAHQINWFTEVVAKAQAPVSGTVSAAIEAGVPFWQDSINKDNIRLEMPYWVSASVTGVF